MSADEKEILEQVRKAIAATLRIPVEQVESDSLLSDDLGAESLDFVDIQFRLETEYGIEFYPGSVVERLAELLAPQKMDAEGLLTDFGAAALRLRMPEVDPDRLRAGRPAAGIEALFTPRTFVRLVKELLDARPRACPACRSDRLKALKPSVLSCKACGAEIRCSDGEELLTAWAKKVPYLLQEAESSLR